MERLKLKNFGPVTSLDIKLKKINVFIGEQGVGKSSVAKVLSCMRDVFLCSLIAMDESTDVVMEIFKVYGIHEYFRDDTEIEYCGGHGLIVGFNDGKFSINHKKWGKEECGKRLMKVCSVALSMTLKKLGYEDGQDLSEVMRKHSKVIAPVLRTSLYCPAERNLAGAMSSSLASMIVANIPLPECLLEYMSIFERAKNACPSYDVAALGLKTVNENGVCKLCIEGRDALPLQYCSSGLQSVIPMLMSIDYCLENRFFNCFAIEEPELNLFPTNQRRLLHYLITKTNAADRGISSLDLTTHSPYVLSILNNLIFAGNILGKYPGLKEQVNEILPNGCSVTPGDIAAFSLNRPDGGVAYCTDIIDDATGLIKANYLDAVSDTISRDFRALHQIYLKAMKESR